MEITIKNEIDPGRICRACLSSENILREMLETDEDYEYFLDAYKTCTSVDLKEIADLPIQICDSCLIRVEEFNTFREMCLRSHDIIQTLVINISANDISTHEVEEVKIESADHFVVDSIDSENVESVVNVQSNVSDTEMAENVECVVEDFNIKETFSCEICFETLDDLQNFRQHHQTMHSTKDYKCAFCREAFSHPALLTRHIKIHKDEISIANEKMYQCGRCDKIYKTLLNLQIHVYSHTGLRPYKCGSCPKAFTKRSALFTHRKIHTGEHGYLCTECGKGFNTILLLNRHKAVHSGVRPFKCKFCPVSFVAPGDLRMHERTHTGEKPYLCSTCGKSFSRTNHLKVHKRIHTGEKPYKCSFCGKCFTQSGDRNVHQRIHTGNKPHMCEICDRRFNHATALMSHKKTHQRTFTCKLCHKRCFKLETFENHLRVHGLEDKRDNSPEEVAKPEEIAYEIS